MRKCIKNCFKKYENSHIADCVFKVCPMLRYTAQKQFWKICKDQAESSLAGSRKSPPDPSLVKKLGTAADSEKLQNEAEYKKVEGTYVQYGATIQVSKLRTAPSIKIVNMTVTNFTQSQYTQCSLCDAAATCEKQQIPHC